MPAPPPAPPAPPAPLVARARASRAILEVGAGQRFDTARALRELVPEARIVVSDVDPHVLLAPLGVESRILDLTHPDVGALGDIDLVYAVRLPEELQLAAARLANALHADLALRPLKDEWADVSRERKRQVVWPDGWRYFPIE